ncbi:MAG: hypothetical protein FJ276_13890 [Planctomycetes bacterium]|nr:hypothetical protein [Planctomycetota bacterium]
MGFLERRKSRETRRTLSRRLFLERLEQRTLLALDLAAIGGTAFVDLTGDGLTADDTRISGATVQLYRDNGDNTFNAGTDTLLGTTTTNASGVYRFASTNAGGTLLAFTLTADDYFVRQLPVVGFSPPAAAMVTITSTQINGTTVETVDTFDTTEQVVTANAGAPTASDSRAAPETIGGERDVLVTFVSGTGDATVEIDRFDSNLFAFACGVNVVGTALVQYDGIDNDATALNATGLGGVSLSNGDANSGLLLATRGDTPGATAQLRVYSSAANFSVATIVIPQQPTIEEVFVPFSAFVLGGGTGADFNSVGAIELFIDGVPELDAIVTVLRSLRPNEVVSNLENDVPSVEITKFTNGQDANTVGSGPFVAVGTTVTFTYVVTSTGGTSLQNVQVRDDNGTPGDPLDDFSPTFSGGDANSNAMLDPGETWTYTATRVVTAGPYTNEGRVTAEDLGGTQVTDTDPSNHFGVAAQVNIVKSTNGQDANTAPGPALPVGSTATFTYVVTNPGNVALGTVTVRDDAGTPGSTGDDFSPTFVSGDTNSNGQLDVGETWTYQATRTVTAGQYANIGSVTGTPLDTAGNPITGLANATDMDPSNHFGATAGINIVKSTNGQDANSPTGPILLVGSTATFTYVVTNTGNVPLATVVVSDDNGTSGNPGDDFLATFQSGDTNGDGRLDTTETWTYQATRVVTLGQHTNVGTVTANPVDTTGADIAGMSDATDTDPSNHLGVATGINIVKSTNGEDANTTTGPLLVVGSTATFTYLVTNTGTTALASVTITDDNGTPGSTGDDFTPTFQSGDTNSNGRLETTETWTYTATRVVTAGQYTNTATVSANPVDASGADIAGLPDVTDNDPSNHFGITTGINVVKSTNGQDANTATGPVLAVGSTATFTYTVTNTGSVALAGVVLTDDNGTPGNTGDDFSPTFQSGDTNANGRLDTSETWTYTATRVVTAGQHTNIATVTGNPVDSNGGDIPTAADVSDTDPSNHFGFTGGIAVQKLTNGIDTGTGSGPTLAVGSTATFTYNVTNTGNIALTNVVLTDNNGTPANTGDDFNPVRISGDTNGNNQLDVTETWVYQATRVVTEGAYSNTATVTASDPNTTLVTATDLSAHTGVNRLSKRRFIASRN